MKSLQKWKTMALQLCKKYISAQSNLTQENGSKLGQSAGSYSKATNCLFLFNKPHSGNGDLQNFFILGLLMKQPQKWEQLLFTLDKQIETHPNLYYTIQLPSFYHLYKQNKSRRGLHKTCINPSTSYVIPLCVVLSLLNQDVNIFNHKISVHIYLDAVQSFFKEW